MRLWNDPSTGRTRRSVVLCSIIVLLSDRVKVFGSISDLDVANEKQFGSRHLQSKEGSRNCKAKVLTPHFLFHKRIKEYIGGNPMDYEKIRKKRGESKVLVNKSQKSFERKELYPSCTFTPIQEGGPTPVLFIVEGRSGSSNTWMTLSKLAGGENEALETVGSNAHQIREFFFDYLETEEKGSWWVTEHLCETTKYNCNSAIAGFQWKPYGDSLESPAGRAALKKIASFQIDDSGERIRVLYMTRNPIDVMVSNVRHSKSTVSAHCNLNDTKCMKQQKKSMDSLYLKTGKVLKNLEKEKEVMKSVKSTLDEMGIDYYHTTYEKLYDSDDAEEWMRIFRYLGRGPTQGLTLEDVEKAFPYAKTTKRSRDQVISNYDEVEALLNGTDLEIFLHD